VEKNTPYFPFDVKNFKEMSKMASSHFAYDSLVDKIKDE
jgi:hypothetical protein